jgi:uncharacterized protein YkwD
MSSWHTTDRSAPGPARRRSTHGLAVLTVVAVLAVCSLWGSSAGAQTAPQGQAPTAVSLPSPGAAEADFIARINQLRSARGLGALSVDPELTTQARQWAATMAGAGRIYHSSDLSGGISANWQKLGENVGVGGDVGSLFQAFVNSPTHYENLVDPAYTRVGVGVVLAGDRLYTAHRFMALAPTPPPPPPTVPPTTAAPTTAPPTTAPPTTAPPPTTTTTEAPSAHKLGPLERIATLIALPDDRAGAA